MSKSTTKRQSFTVDEEVDPNVLTFRARFNDQSPIDQVVRESARRMLQSAIDAEVESLLFRHSDRVDEQGCRLVVKNGSLPARAILTGAGALEVKQGRVRDNTPDSGKRVQFTPSVFPAYLRRSEGIEELLPWLYLKVVSTGDFAEALQALVGERAKGLSANVIVRLKEKLGEEYDQGCLRDLTGKKYVYVWADGLHAKVRLEDDAIKKRCILVLVGAIADGKKELIAVLDGYRESEQSWSELLLSLTQRGFSESPKISVGDGALGFWAALRKVFPDTVEKRRWVHKTANVLNKMPKSLQPKAKGNFGKPKREPMQRKPWTTVARSMVQSTTQLASACEKTETKC